MCKNFSSGSGFERMKGSWTAADTWHSESPGESVSKDASAFAVDKPIIECDMERA